MSDTPPSSSKPATRCEITYFASPERLPAESVLKQATKITHSPLSEALMNGGPHCTLVLNAHRQIVAFSKNIDRLLNEVEIQGLLGMRPGEALNCIHAKDCAGGCGTSEYCRECGAVRAILGGLAGRQELQECRLTRNRDGDIQHLDLHIFCSPLTMDGENFVVVTIHDISSEKRRQNMERIFFHDVINLAGGMEGLLLNLRESAPPELRREVELSYATLRELMEEIISQRDLSAAERNELNINPRTTTTLTLLSQVERTYRSHPSLSMREIAIDPQAEAAVLETDPVLVRRVLGNLIKNAGEACEPGQMVRLSCSSANGRVRFSVNNPQVLSSEVRHQIFQRSFSTKGIGRGLGTYSVKLIGEKFLRGKVSFTSEEGKGTTFCLELPTRLE